MLCDSLGRQSEEPVQRQHWSCEATACVAGMLDDDNSEGGFEHEHEHEYDCWDKGWHERIPAWGFAGKSRDSLRLHPCAWMQIRNLRVRSECVMSPLAVGMAWGWTGYAARGTSRELLLPHKKVAKGLRPAVGRVPPEH